MKHSSSSIVFTISLTIFAMLFGAGNLMFPLAIGIESGQHTMLGFIGFALTGIVLPVLGLMTIVAFDGDYRKFFGRLGPRLSELFILICMLVIGPLVAMPRIITLSYEMLQPFLPKMSTFVFALLFCSLVFLATYRPTKLLDLIGRVLSPLKVGSLILIVVIGLFSGVIPAPVAASSREIFMNAFNMGYVTLDVLGAIFFGSIVVTLMTKYSVGSEKLSLHQAVKIAGVASVFAGILLGLVYLGMTYLGAFHGYGLEHLLANPAAIFSQISFRVLGSYGAALIGFTVFLACFVTTMTLSAVVGEYIQVKMGKRLSYAQAVALLLIFCSLVASLGLTDILRYSFPFIFFFYPLIIVITICNLLYKFFGFTYIKIPVLLSALAMLPSLIINIQDLL